LAPSSMNIVLNRSSCASSRLFRNGMTTAYWMISIYIWPDLNDQLSKLAHYTFLNLCLDRPASFPEKPALIYTPIQ
jgi:hypothetical protein